MSKIYRVTQKVLIGNEYSGVLTTDNDVESVERTRKKSIRTLGFEVVEWVDSDAPTDYKFYPVTTKSLAEWHNDETEVLNKISHDYSTDKGWKRI